MEGPRFRRLFDAVSHFAAVTPDAPAAWSEGTTITYSTLWQQVDHAARALVGWGLEPGERVAVLSTPRTEFLVALLAIHRAGGIYVGVNPGFTPREQLHVVRDSSPAMILSLAESAGREYANDVATLAAEVASVRGCFRLDAGPSVGCLHDSEVLSAHADDATALPDPAERDPSTIVYTSGSSGAPKGALLPHATLAYGAHCDADNLAVVAPRVACNLPTNHIGCIVDVCGSTLVSGGMVAFVERFDPGQMLAMIESLRLTNLMHVPTVLQLLTMHPDFETRDLSSLQAIAWGGAALPIDIVRTYRRHGVRMGVVYGMTETCANITFSHADDPDEVLASTVGRPNPDAEVRLVDDDGADVPDGSEGEIWYRHPDVMLGYWQNPAATAATLLPDGWLRTGDVGVRDPDGNVRLVGRRSDMFKSRGLNVYPREIELVLEDHPAVALAAVVGVPHPTYAEVGVAFVVCEPGAVSADDLVAWCRRHLAAYKVPVRIELRTDLPLLPVGKVDKAQLRAEATAPPPT